MEKLQQWRRKQEGKIGYILLGARRAHPVLFVIFLLRGCTCAPRRARSVHFSQRRLFDESFLSHSVSSA